MQQEMRELEYEVAAEVVPNRTQFGQQIDEWEKLPQLALAAAVGRFFYPLWQLRDYLAIHWNFERPAWPCTRHHSIFHRRFYLGRLMFLQHHESRQAQFLHRRWCPTPPSSALDLSEPPYSFSPTFPKLPAWVVVLALAPEILEGEFAWPAARSVFCRPSVLYPQDDCRLAPIVETATLDQTARADRVAASGSVAVNRRTAVLSWIAAVV